MSSVGLTVGIKLQDRLVVLLIKLRACGLVRGRSTKVFRLFAMIYHHRLCSMLNLQQELLSMVYRSFVSRKDFDATHLLRFKIMITSLS